VLFGDQAKLGADMFFDGRVNVGKGANRARNGTGPNFVPRCQKPAAAPRHLGVKTGKGQAHGRRFGMDAVAAANADRVLVFKGTGLQRGKNPVHPKQQKIRCANQLNVQRGIQNVAAGHALMHKAGIIRPDMFGKMGQKGDDVMFGDGLNFINSGHVKGDIAGAPDGLGIGFGDNAKGGLGIAGMRLDLIPDAEFGLRVPNGNHVWAGIARDHHGPLIGRIG
jgi:hypothetical protein